MPELMCGVDTHVHDGVALPGAGAQASNRWSAALSSVGCGSSPWRYGML